jgi:hypothetical protein
MGEGAQSAGEVENESFLAAVFDCNSLKLFIEDTT